jgi:hypothetical protein
MFVMKTRDTQVNASQYTRLKTTDRDDMQPTDGELPWFQYQPQQTGFLERHLEDATTIPPGGAVRAVGGWGEAQCERALAAGAQLGQHLLVRPVVTAISATDSAQHRHTDELRVQALWLAGWPYGTANRGRPTRGCVTAVAAGTPWLTLGSHPAEHHVAARVLARAQLQAQGPLVGESDVKQTRFLHGSRAARIQAMLRKKSPPPPSRWSAAQRRHRSYLPLVEGEHRSTGADRAHTRGPSRVTSLDQWFSLINSSLLAPSPSKAHTGCVGDRHRRQ